MMYAIQIPLDIKNVQLSEIRTSDLFYTNSSGDIEVFNDRQLAEKFQVAQNIRGRVIQILLK